MRTLSIVNAYFKNAGMLQVQYDNLASFPDDLKARLQYVVCDDASPEGQRAERPKTDLGLPVEVFRIHKKRAWNWIAARNIGAHHATGDWLLFTDMDHLVPEETARRVLDGKLDPGTVYRFARVDAPNLTPYKPHPNSWLMTREMFDRFGGFDERFSGCYGSDGTIRDRLYALAGAFSMIEEPLVRYPREVVADASTTDFGPKGPKVIRKGSEYNARVAEIRERIERKGGAVVTMGFEYSRVD